ncbi:MAG TPA: ammonium transporter [Acidimicrobiia bacterium]|jgi:Amt family ammonium transporter
MEPGDVAFVLVAAALVLFMTPGLALFYGGMVRAKNVLNMLMMNFVTIGIVTAVWTAIGYSIAFDGTYGNIIGRFGKPFLNSVESDELLFFAFQMMFAIITPALISGAVAGRMKFSAWIAFAAAWALIVYPIAAHWGFGSGWLFEWGARDFAGGLVIHINAGVAALALVLVLGPRRGFGTEAMRPHSLPLTLVGAGILWFGWFGFNAGSALAADEIAVSALVMTQIGASFGLLGWMIAEWRKSGKPTVLGAASGAVAGLVAITPAAGFVDVLPSMIIGLAAGGMCFWAVNLKERYGYDDSLDVVGIHMVGGIVGSLATGVFASIAVNPGLLEEGLLYGGGGLFLKQLVGVVAILTFSFVATYAIAKVIDATIGLRADEDAEIEGLDIRLHEERAYTNE